MQIDVRADAQADHARPCRDVSLALDLQKVGHAQAVVACACMLHACTAAEPLVSQSAELHDCVWPAFARLASRKRTTATSVRVWLAPSLAPLVQLLQHWSTRACVHLQLVRRGRVDVLLGEAHVTERPRLAPGGLLVMRLGEFYAAEARAELWTLCNAFTRVTIAKSRFANPCSVGKWLVCERRLARLAPPAQAPLAWHCWLLAQQSRFTELRERAQREGLELYRLLERHKKADIRYERLLRLCSQDVSRLPHLPL